jgi:hypothetical protein
MSKTLIGLQTEVIARGAVYQWAAIQAHTNKKQ